MFRLHFPFAAAAILLFGLFGCAATAVNQIPIAATSAAMQDKVNAVETSQVILSARTLPIQSSWILGSNPLVSTKDAILGTHVILITDKQTTIIYSISSDQALNDVTKQSLSLKDDKDNNYKVGEPQLLASLDGLQIVSATFQNPAANAGKLEFELQPSDQMLAMKATVAQIDPPNSEPPVLEGSQILIPRDGYLDQGNYRVSFNGFYTSTDNLAEKQQSAKGITTEELLKQSANETPNATDLTKPIPQNPITVQLADGKTVLGEATIRVEDIESRQVRFLYIVFLPDGETKSTWLE